MDTASTLNSAKGLVAAVLAACEGSRVLHVAQAAPLMALGFTLLALTATVLTLRRLGRLPLTLRAVAWSAPLSRRLSHWVKSRDYIGDTFFLADGAPPRWLEKRRGGLERLAATLRERAPDSIDWGKSIREGFSDLRFTDANRVPFRFGA